ncbi:MAG: hypothetical protein CVU56_25260 [Deltaproteobacteria bacterium HGW-Deltaproteobacteria-14]|jgi:hypothetical protein|nr:MAG: hypothetical protein CVU56_25260 [Deltaproteobacteria bacterium HGW-Deltaproteobacteria-14]
MATRTRHSTAALVASLLIAGCALDAPSEAAPGLSLDIAALNLDGVGDVVWDVAVLNGASTPAVVWQRRIASSRHGDGAGSASYVGTCDADPTGDVSLNTVEVWVVGVFAAPVTALGSFASGAPGGVVGTSLDFEDPTASAPLTREVRCSENGDNAVRFDVALMRPAEQGFFDVAVNFDDIFCAAKFDCCAATQDGTGCASDLDLLFTADGARGPTMVLGFACTAGPDDDGETQLYLDPLELDCSSPSDFTTGFAADLILDPSGPAGNQCVPGDTGMSACSGVVSGAAPDTYLFQLAVFRGVEALTSAGVRARKVYWNVALGVKRPAIDGCWLRTRGTADDPDGSPGVAGGVVAAGTVYPCVRWEVKLGSCHAEPLTYGDPGAMVRPAYTATDGGDETFAYGFGPSLPAGPFALPCSDEAPRVYAYSGGVVTATVPSGCTRLYGELWGAGGGGVTAGGRGGGGGYTAVDGVAVTPLTPYAVVVGQGGASPCAGQCAGIVFASAFGGGGAAHQGNGGGGYSGVFGGTTPDQAAAFAVAGGGGGGGASSYASHGGAGGGASGGAGAYGTSNTSHTGGGGGTATAGGAAAYNDYPTTAAHGTDGAALLGGSTSAGNGYGGGGGGGYWGGGSGGRDGYWNHRGGGGGSGFVKDGAGSLVAGSGQTPGGTTSVNYAPGVAVGGTTVSVRGGDGRVVLWFR